MAFCGYLKQSTTATLMLGPFVDEDDGKTAETALTIAQADVRLSKNGGNMAQKTEATSCTHDEIGIYSCPIDATDTGTLGLLDVMVHESGALPVHQTYQVVTANWWDTMCSTDTLQADLTQMGGVAQSATDLKDFADAGYDPATNKVQGVVLVDTTTTNTDLVTAAAVVNEWETQSQADPTGFHVNVLEVGGTSQTANDNGADINAILIDTAVIGALGAGLTAIPWNSAWDTEVESEVTDALVAHNLDHLALTATAAADMTTEVADNTILSRILANGDTSAFVPSTDGLQLIRDKLTDIETDTAEIGTAGAGLTDLGGMSTSMKAEVEAECTDALEADGLDHLVAASVIGTDVADNSIIAKMVADDATADWDTFNNTTDSLEAIRNNQAGADTAAIADAVWDEATSGHVGVGTFGAQCGTDIDAILVDTNELQTDDVPGLISGLNNFDPANDAVASVTLVDTVTTLTGHTAQTGDTYNLLSSAGGSATSNGAADGTTVIDSAQTGANDLYNALAIKITSGDYNGQIRTIKDWDLASTTFTMTRGFGGQIVTGVTYQVVSALVYQPGITLVPSASALVEPDTLETISLAITTNAGAPSTGEITPGTITIARVRDSGSTNIVTSAACSEAAGNIYYAYTYPSASWQAGDYYLATMAGQEIQVNGITYPLSIIPFRGYVTRDAAMTAAIATVDGNVDSILTDTGTTLPATLTTLEGKIDTVDTNVDAVLVDTGTTLPATLTTIEGKIDTADTVVDAILVDTGTTLPATLAGLNDISAADVNAQVLDVMNTDTFAEPGQEAPGATVSLVTKIGYLYKAFRNKIVQDATTLEIYNDAGAVVDQKATISDDGTDYTRGEIGTGP
jgi:hypothetical protein